VIALDGPAHGDSEGEQTNAAEFSRTLIKIQKSLGPLKAIISHSFGAGCAVMATANGMDVEKLVLIAGPSDYHKVVNFYLNRLELSPRARAHFVEKLTALAKVSPEELNISKIGVQIQSEILIVHDKNDKEVRFHAAEELHQAWPKSQLLATTGLGHRRVLRDPQVIQRVKLFIN
jgi:pimeloyl-ACP methyl ester carboxylesterase